MQKYNFSVYLQKKREKIFKFKKKIVPSRKIFETKSCKINNK